MADEIPRGTRIVSVDDAFEAMSCERHHRKAFPKDVALSRLAEGRGTQFNADVLDVLATLVALDPDRDGDFRCGVGDETTGWVRGS